MALGFREAVNRDPLPKTDVAPTQADQQQGANDISPIVIPFSSGKSRIIGPTDPLSGPTSPDDLAGLTGNDGAVVNLLKKILVASRALHPTTPISIKGGLQLLAANSGETYKFFLNNRPVPALNIIVQNNSGQTVFVGLDDQPSIQGLQIASGAEMTIADVHVHFLSIWVTAQTFINGIDNQRVAATTAQVTQGVVLMAWSNPEYFNIWGESS